MMRMAALLVGLAAGTLAAAEVPPVSVYVGPAVTPDGFVNLDAQIAESVAHLKEVIRKQRGLLVTEDARSAQVALYVVGRTVSGAPDAATATTLALPGSATTIVAPSGGTHHLEALLRAGSHERRFVGSSQQWTTSTWKRCARLLVKDLAVWIAANRERLTK